MNSKGQSLIELVVALGLLAVIITILAVATITGLQNSQFSKNQALATKLAQEGQEKIRTIRARNYTVCGPNPSSPTGVKDWNSIYGSDMNCQATPSLACSYVLATIDTPPAIIDCTATEFWLNNVNTTQPEQIMNEGVNFDRIITIKDYGVVPNRAQKEVTVTVSWTDFSGVHSSKLVTVLADL